MNPDSDEFVQFLRTLGVEMEDKAQSIERERTSGRHQRSERSLDEPEVTILRYAEEDEALYHLSLAHTTPQLRVVLPDTQGQLKFLIYLIQFSEHHPLASVFTQFARYRGSHAFEQKRKTAQQHLLAALGEIMKDLFWEGVDVSEIPPEITVEELL
ncbi:hypothetical protein [Ktedonospora formicarum]|uniref:Uncharacterized protein n=1 Tax=Ktedonospora formicarum TaxID=2778364 RepID=A0A8J3ICV5_9CHLR|nr:hypothetical protein [Ktedonospora formicarum]GHO50865.1 hypothetical protein KSX_90280 [Ktedonospora formicarum]